MQIFIPTKREAAALYPGVEFKVIDGLEITENNIIITGCGKVNTAVTLTKYLEKNKLKTPVLAGIAGAYKNSGISVGTVAYIEYDHFVDEGLFCPDTKKITGTHEMGFEVCPSNQTCFKIPDDSLMVLNANTVSLMPTDDSLSEMYRSKTGAHLESMEGAAFAHAAYIFGIQAVQIRAVSNLCGYRNTQQWNIKLAVKNLKKFLDKLL